MNFLSKLLFYFRKPKVILVTGEESSFATEVISQILKQYLKIGKEVLISETDVKNHRDFKFLIKYSRLPILVIAHFGKVPSGQVSFSGEKKEIEEILKLAKILPSRSPLILNFDDEIFREMKHLVDLNILTFGFQEGADFRATDIKLNTGTNFKLNYQGNIIPFWLEGAFNKEKIYVTLAATAVGVMFGLNLVEISQSLKSYKSFSDK